VPKAYGIGCPWRRDPRHASQASAGPHQAYTCSRYRISEYGLYGPGCLGRRHALARLEASLDRTA
jgi:hypothetical protein